MCMVEIAKRQLCGNVREFVKHLCLGNVIVEEDGLISKMRRAALMKMARSATNVWSLSSVKRTIF